MYCETATYTILTQIVPACTAHLYHLDDFLCCGHVDLLQAHNLNLLPVIFQNPKLGLLVQQVIHLNQKVYFTLRKT